MKTDKQLNYYKKQMIQWDCFTDDEINMWLNLLKNGELNWRKFKYQWEKR